MKKNLSLALALLSLVGISSSNAQLAMVGDIAFTGVSGGDAASGNNDSFAFVPFVNIGVGEVIFFRDDELGTGPVTEGALRWEATSMVSAGSVIEIDFNALANTGTANTGTVTETDAAFGLASAGDGLFAYLSVSDNDDVPTAWLSAINFSSSSPLSLVGTGLVYGTNAIDLGSGALDFEYTEGTTNFASFAAARSHLNNVSNWSSDNTANANPHVFPLGAGDAITVPEPSTYALIFGSFALGFVILRRKFQSSKES